MNNVIIIDFNELNSLKNRSSVKSAFENISYADLIKVDFRGIEFLSRTAAHELLKIKEVLNSKKIDVSFLNLSDQVGKMLGLVEASYTKSKNADFRFVKWLSFQSEDQYNEYLLSIE
jgi:anti-anti-sigma regulatory factor